MKFLRQCVSYTRDLLRDLKILFVGSPRSEEEKRLAHESMIEAEADGRPPTLPPAPYRSGLWGRIPSGDPDDG